MKTTPNKDKTINIRINSEQYKYLKIASYMIGSTPSKMIRMFIDSTTNALAVKVKSGEIKIENFEAVFNNKL